MVKNRVAKMAARSRASQNGTSYTGALTVSPGIPTLEPLNLALGMNSHGNQVTWPGRFRQHFLMLQGSAASGKTTLLERLANQARGQAAVYVCSASGRLNVSGAAGYGDGIDSSVELIRSLVHEMNETLAAARRHLDVMVSDKERKSLAHQLRMELGADIIKQLPDHLQPRRRVLFVDDFDVLCRSWQWSGQGDIRSKTGPRYLMSELAQQGGDVDLWVVVGGESLSRSTAHIEGSRLLLGPSSLAEREAFLRAANAAEDPGRWAGLYEDSIQDVVHVRLAAD